MMLAQKKKCSECGGEFSVEQFVVKYRNGISTFTKCRQCRQKDYVAKYREKQLGPMPWFVK